MDDKIGRFGTLTPRYRRELLEIPRISLGLYRTPAEFTTSKCVWSYLSSYTNSYYTTIVLFSSPLYVRSESSSKLNFSLNVPHYPLTNYPHRETLVLKTRDLGTSSPLTPHLRRSIRITSDRPAPFSSFLCSISTDQQLFNSTSQFFIISSSFTNLRTILRIPWKLQRVSSIILWLNKFTFTTFILMHIKY